jgi:hypothetical protein
MQSESSPAAVIAGPWVHMPESVFPNPALKHSILADILTAVFSPSQKIFEVKLKIELLTLTCTCF